MKGPKKKQDVKIEWRTAEVLEERRNVERLPTGTPLLSDYEAVEAEGWLFDSLMEEWRHVRSR